MNDRKAYQSLCLMNKAVKSESDGVLVRLNTALWALSRAKTLQEAKHIADVAEAARVYAKRSKHGKRQQQLKTLPPRKMRRVHRKEKIYYVYADPAQNLIYVGNQLQYDQNRDLRLAKNVFEQDLQDAEPNAREEAGWEAWGPFY